MRRKGPWKRRNTLMTDSMGQRWGTNKTLTATTGEGHAFVFIAVVHCPGELVDTHASSTVPLYTL